MMVIYRLFHFEGRKDNFSCIGIETDETEILVIFFKMTLYYPSIYWNEIHNL